MTWRQTWRLLVASLALGATLVALAAFAYPSQLPAVPPPHERLLVADLRGHALLVVDPIGVEPMRRIPLPGGPHELLALPDGRIAVSLEQYGLIALVDVEGGQVEVVEVGGVPHGLALLDGVLLVTDRTVDLVRRFEVRTWRELEPLAVDAWPHAVAVLPSREIAVASAGAGTLQIGAQRFATGAVTETVDVTLDGRVATASAYDGTVHVFSEEGELLEWYEVGGRPVRVRFSDDGRTLAVALSAAGAVAVIQDGQARVVPVSGVPDGLAFSSDGRWLYVSDVYAGVVTVVDATRGEVAAELPVGIATGAMLTLAP